MSLGDLREVARWCTPSALTMSALLSGLSAVRFAAEEDFSSSVLCIMCAAVLDGLDGHVARYLGACTKLGFELDSLCDLANFGVTPALVVYFWSKALPTKDCRSERCQSEQMWLWAACCAYTGSCAFRLARFNVAGHAAEMDHAYLETKPGRQRPPVKKAVWHNFHQRKMYFHGVPAPVAAAYALTPIMLHFCLAPWVPDQHNSPWSFGRRGAGWTLLLTAFLMIAPLPTFSSKMLKTDASDSHLRSRHPASLAAKAACGMFFAVLCWRHPFGLVLLCNLMHLVSIPVSIVVFYTVSNGAHDD